jgi:hypothetical protein
VGAHPWASGDGHYFPDGDYSKAKEDFAVRSGLIDQRKLFTETELKLIKDNLVKIGDITPDGNFDKMAAIRAVVEKIDAVLVPQMKEAEEARQEEIEAANAPEMGDQECGDTTQGMNLIRLTRCSRA